MSGTLYLVSTPIGNLEDITLRALRILKEVDIIAAEDTRHTRQLLSHFDIHVPLVSCHAFNEHDKVDDLIVQVQNGKNIGFRCRYALGRRSRIFAGAQCHRSRAFSGGDPRRISSDLCGDRIGAAGGHLYFPWFCAGQTGQTAHLSALNAGRSAHLIFL